MSSREAASDELNILEQGHKSRGIGNKILRIIWDNDDKTDEERRFVHKLDSVLMTIVSLPSYYDGQTVAHVQAILGYFVKYLSQANIS
jgi:hypothetical protein